MTVGGDTEADISRMRRALQLARSAEASGEVPVGALLLAPDGIIVAESFNACIGTSDPTAHAEILALRTAAQAVGNYRLPGHQLYVTLEPCPMCAAAMVHARIERVVFGASDPKTGACGSVYDLVRDRRLNHRLIVEAGVLADDCGKLLQEFFKARR